MSARMPLILEVLVTVQKGTIKVTPDPAYVDQGTFVQWLFVAPEHLGELNVEVYFSKGSPMKWPANDMGARTGEAVRGHVSASIRGVAEEPGDYKYGVRARVAGTKEIVADDDPRLIVLPR